jgi:drug/metabolite transporter (DMT)-like permease
MNIALYISTVLIWGSTWIAIYWQVGDVPPLISIFYRFTIAGALFLPLLILLGKVQKTQKKDHLFFFLQGVCLFSFNYICMYNASHYIISGLISVIFAMATLFNAFNQWLIWRKQPSPAIYIAGLLGITGLVLLFWPQLQDTQNSHDIIWGVLLSMGGTYFFSLGNMVSMRNSQQGIHPWTSNAYGMAYAAVLMLVIIWLLGIDWRWDSRDLYLWSLLYLAIPGSIIGFTIYLVLLARIGANKAAYTSVLFPVVALTISTFFEDYRWDTLSVTGLALVMLGVVVSSRGEQLLALGRRYFRAI